MLVNCDYCGAKFVLRPQIQFLANNVERNYFSCTECGEEYTTYYSNPAIKKLREKLSQLRQRYDNQRLTNPKQAERTYKKWLKDKEVLNKAVHRLLMVMEGKK